MRFEKSNEVVGVENQWHTDVSWRERPALGSLLRAIDVPPYGGDTLFADMVAAYEGLPPELQELVTFRDEDAGFGSTSGEGELWRVLAATMLLALLFESLLAWRFGRR